MDKTGAKYSSAPVFFRGGQCVDQGAGGGAAAQLTPFFPAPRKARQYLGGSS